MLRVSYLKTYGHIILKGSDGNKYKCLMHPANCLYATVYHNNKRNTVELIDFFSDIKHLERCLKDNIFADYTKVVIYLNTDFKEKWQVAKLFNKYGYNVQMVQVKRWTKKYRRG